MNTDYIFKTIYPYYSNKLSKYQLKTKNIDTTTPSMADLSKLVKHNVRGTDQSVSIRFTYDLCVGCQMCVKACTVQQKIGCLQQAPLKQPPFLHSGSGKNHENTDTTRVKMEDTNCIGCGQCVVVCTTGAMSPNNKCSEILIAKQNKQTLIAVLAPATRVGISEGMGMPLGSSAQNQLVAGLKQIGFNYVFDNQWGADVTTMADAQEALKIRELGKGPVFTSCCPAWINLVETRYPELIPNISTSRSPHGITCSVIKKYWTKENGLKPDDIFVVGVMPCTAKKFEAARKQLTTEGVRDCDLSITTREIIELFKESNITFSEEREKELEGKPEAQIDAPFNEFSGSAYIFGKTSGVTESVVRYIYHKNGIQYDKSVITENMMWESQDKLHAIKLFEFKVGESQFRAVICSGGSAVEECVALYKAGRLEQVDIVEVMMCPQGCINGGGQPKLIKRNLIPNRKAGLDAHDAKCAYKDADSNQKMHELLAKWMPTEHELHDGIHTHYVNRRMK